MDSRQITDTLIEDLRSMHFGPPVTHVYNPLTYARAPHDLYLSRYGQGPKDVVLLGMNPGPWGMAQTGVPFGEVTAVRDWLGIEAPVNRPAHWIAQCEISNLNVFNCVVHGSGIQGPLDGPLDDGPSCSSALDGHPVRNVEI